MTDPLPEAGTLEIFLLAILERHDGLCLDNGPERVRLASALAAALLAAGSVEGINQSAPPLGIVLPDSLPQTIDSSASTPPLE